MTQDRVILVLSFVLLVFIDIQIGMDKGVFYTLFAICLLITELVIHSRYKADMSKQANTIIKIKSNEWIGGFFIAVFLIYSLVDEKYDWDAFDYVASGLIMAYGALYAMRNRTTNYIFNKDGVTGMTDRKKISSSIVEEINVGQQSLVIHTSEFRNHLIINSNRLVQPDWDHLLERMAELQKTWANKM